ncbi:hypothetical protein GCM10009836_10940 [Pseudonocardia ailaonensis]|uniref:Uncharacterized protein n=1 Tax=Pseudonocardia ailaonensis TaxID=367279 RepID=A0ABN2MQE6_9PSEU
MSAPFEIDNTVRPTVRMPRVDKARPYRSEAAPAQVFSADERGPADEYRADGYRADEYRARDFRTTSLGNGDQTPRPTFDAQRLWTGGLATAAVAALVGLVGTLVLRVAFQFAPAAHLATFGTQQTAVLCAVAAGAALVATGIAHLLMVSTPRPLAYLGWIVGLVTAAATVIPLVNTTAITLGLAQGALHLVIGLAIGTLVGGAAASATRVGARALR